MLGSTVVVPAAQADVTALYDCESSTAGTPTPTSFTVCGGGQLGAYQGQISWYAYGASGWNAKVQTWACSFSSVRSGSNDVIFTGTQSGLSGTINNPCPGSKPYLTGVWVNGLYNGGAWLTTRIQSLSTGMDCLNGPCQTKPTYSLSLSSDVFGVSAGEGAILTATASQDVSKVGGVIRLRDVTANNGWINCVNTGTLCRSEVYIPAGVAHTFRAQVVDAGGQVLATSNDVIVNRAAWSVSLSYDQPNSPVVATANQNPGATGGAYRLEIFNADTGSIQLSCATNPCDLNVADPATHYIAQVAPPASTLASTTDLQARSGVVFAPTTGPTGDDARCQCEVRDPIDTASGQLHETAADLAVAGRNGGLAVTRSYLSGDAAQEGQFGYGWQPSYSAWLGVVAPSGYGQQAAMADGTTPPAPSPIRAIDASPPHPQMVTYPTDETVHSATVVILSSDPNDIPADAQSRHEGADSAPLLAANIVSIDIHLPGVGTVSFQPVGAGSDTYAPVGGHLPDTLVHNADGTWTLTERHRETLVFNELGWLISESDLNGDTATLGYDSHARLATVTDAAGRTLTYTYNAAGYVSTVSDTAGRTVQYGYDSAGNLTSVTDPAGAVTGYGYSGHLLTTFTDPRGHTTTNTYDTLGHVTQQVDRAGRTTQLAYSFGNPETVTITESNGSTTTQQYTDGGDCPAFR